MRVAIPTFRSQVSPRFDCANLALLVDIENGQETRRIELPLYEVPPFARAGFLRSQGVHVLLCGGLRRRDYFELTMNGIEVFAGLFGEVEEILRAFCEGRLQPTPPPVMPPGHRRHGPGHGHGRRHGGHGGGRGRRYW